MRIIRVRDGLSFLGCAALTATAAGAAEQAGPDRNESLEEVVVSANRIPVAASKIGSTVDIIGIEQLERERQPFLKEYLESVPGVNLTQFGPPGTQANLTMRGAGGGYVVVRIDGMEMSDNSGTTPSTDIAQITAGDLGRIEVLKGSQSALYGGQAIAGVVDITTRRADPNTISHRAMIEGGSYSTKQGLYSLSAAGDRAYGTATFSIYSSDGYSAFNEDRGAIEDDGYRNRTYSFSGGIDVSDAVNFTLAGRYNEYRLEYDDTGRDNFTNLLTGTNKGARVGANFENLQGRLRNSFGVEHFDAHRNYMAFQGLYDGLRTKADYLGNFRINDAVAITWGSDWRKDEIELSPNAGDLATDTNLWGVCGEIAVSPFDALTLTAAVRNDDHSTFGNKATVRGTGVFTFPSGTRLRASYGTGFRPPSLFELFAVPYGNSTLTPETSKSFDVGLEQAFGSRVRFGLTYFTLDTENLIGFDNATFTYYQIGGRTEREGFEFGSAFVVTDWLSLNANYTNTDTRTAAGTRLTYVPRHDASAGIVVGPLANTTLSLTVKRIDNVPQPSAPGRRMPNYTLANLVIGYDLGERIEIYGRVDNLFDEQYETTYQYGTADRSAYAGMRLRF